MWCSIKRGMHLINQFDEETPSLKGSFSGKWCWNGPCLGPTGNFRMCKENVSVYVYHVESVGNLQKGPAKVESYDVINYEGELKMELAPALVTEQG